MIHYIKGDATHPIGEGNKVIAHICNDVGCWGRGFVLAISKKWQDPEKYYKQWHKNQTGIEVDNDKIEVPFELGNTLFVPVEYTGSPPSWNRVFVANMIAQHGISSKLNIKPIRYDALESCLEGLRKFVEHLGDVTVHMPRIGCGLAGGEWAEVEKIIERTLDGVDVFVYDLV